MTLRVGFAGLGAIGRPMAVHVAERFETAVWNRTIERAREFAASTGATVPTSDPDAASAAARSRDSVSRNGSGWSFGAQHRKTISM